MSSLGEDLIDSWLELVHAWKTNGLNPDYLVDEGEAIRIIRSLDTTCQGEMDECLIELANKPRALVDLSRIMERGGIFKTDDSLEAVRCYPCLCFLFKQQVTIEDGTSGRRCNTRTKGTDDDVKTTRRSSDATQEDSSIDDGIKVAQPHDMSSQPLSLVDNYSTISLGLSIRASNALQRNGISCLADLAGYHLDDLRALKNLGDTSVREIAGSIERLGLSLPFTIERVDVYGSKNRPGTASTSLMPERLRELGLRPNVIMALEAAGLIYVSDLNGLNENDLLNISGFNKHSLLQLRNALAKNGMDIWDEIEETSQTETSSQETFLQSKIETLREWAAFRGLNVETTLGEILRLEDEELPDDVRSARSGVTSMIISQQCITRENKCSLLDDLRSALNPRLLAVLDRRRWSEHPDTLAEIGSDLSITKEAARQLQEKGYKEAIKYASTNKQLRWFLHEVRYRTGVLTTKDRLNNLLMEYGVGFNSKPWLMLLDLAGPYKIVHDNYIELVGNSYLDMLIDEIKQRAESCGKLPHEDLFDMVSHSGLIENDTLTDLCERVIGLRSIKDIWYPWKGSVADKAFVILKAEGGPMTAEEINLGIGEGHSQGSLTNRMASDDRFRRSSKIEWSLTEWGYEEYTGIADELYRRIEAGGGVASMQLLIEDLVTTCGVRESSVRMYLSTPAFIIEGDQVRRRLDFSTIELESSLRTATGTYRFGSVLRYEIRVTTDVLRGSGQAIPVGTAVALGITPGKKRTFISQDGMTLYVGWREWSTSGPDIGSMRLFAEAVNAKEGDYIVITFNIEDQALEVQHEISSLDSKSVLRMITGTDNDKDINALIAQSIEVKRSEVKSALRERGDERIASMLPAIESGGEDLDIAIHELVGELM